VRSILVASSRAQRTPPPAGPISTDREGAGTLSPAWAERIVRRGLPGEPPDDAGYQPLILGALTDLSSGCLRGQDAQVPIAGHAGHAMRAAISWDSHPELASSLDDASGDRRKSDLDLLVIGPDGIVVAGAATSRAGLFAGNTEWLDWEAAADGTYTIRVDVSRWDCDLPAEPVGVAWLTLPSAAR
jgi:hypothetical protein